MGFQHVTELERRRRANPRHRGQSGPKAYLLANPDVAESGMDPLVHLRKHGLKEAGISSILIF